MKKIIWLALSFCNKSANKLNRNIIGPKTFNYLFIHFILSILNPIFHYRLFFSGSPRVRIQYSKPTFIRNSLILLNLQYVIVLFQAVQFFERLLRLSPY